jgi:hypothetical protein
MWQVFSFFLVYTGAVVFWLLKGMKTTVEFEASRMFDDDFKYYRNLLTGLVVFVIVFFLLHKYFTKE